MITSLFAQTVLINILKRNILPCTVVFSYYETKCKIMVFASIHNNVFPHISISVDFEGMVLSKILISIKFPFQRYIICTYSRNFRITAAHGALTPILENDPANP